MNKIDLSNRVAIVTGGASGLGFGVAARMLKSGACVAIWDVNDSTLTSASATLASHGGISAHSVDVSHYQSVAAATDAVIARWGRIDILVNNAGINRPPAPIGEASLKDWDDVIAIDLTGVFYCCRAIIPKMIAGGYGRVVNVASVAGKEGNPQMIAYSAAKAGVIALTKCLGKELATTGIVVNCITPTVVDTPMNRKTTEASPELSRQILAKIPMGRRGTVEELAAMAAWVASEECSFTTGATFDFSGGRATY